jgi:lipoate---protein ligase
MGERFGRIISDQPGDAYMGLAVDHSLLLQQHQGHNVATVRFWICPKSVIIGRGQSLELEVDQDFCRENNIRVCRRISGGGAVYHDEGNLNVSLIYPRRALGSSGDVREVTRLLPSLLHESLRQSGFDGLTFDDLNGIHFKGYKVSGAASYLSRDTVLNHSTLLLSVNLGNLERSLLHPESARRSSKYSPTMNISNLNVEAWKQSLIRLLEYRFDAAFIEDALTTEESRLAERLSEKLYSSEGWIRAGEYPDHYAM